MPTLNLRHLLQRGSFFLLPASSGWYNQLKSPEFISCAIHYLSRVLLNSFMVSLLNFTLTKTSNTTFPCLDKSIFIRGKTSAQFFKFFHIILTWRNAFASRNSVLSLIITLSVCMKFLWVIQLPSTLQKHANR